MLRKKTSENDPADWFAFAAERIRGADVLMQHEGITALGIEALQEGIERYLKGYLVAQGWSLVKTHDLERLIRDATQYDAAFAQFVPLAIEVTEDFFAQHYPGDDTTNIGQNYKDLRAQAQQLIALIQKSVPQHFSSSPI